MSSANLINPSKSLRNGGKHNHQRNIDTSSHAVLYPATRQPRPTYARRDIKRNAGAQIVQSQVQPQQYCNTCRHGQINVADAELLGYPRSHKVYGFWGCIGRLFMAAYIVGVEVCFTADSVEELLDTGV